MCLYVFFLLDLCEWMCTCVHVCVLEYSQEGACLTQRICILENIRQEIYAKNWCQGHCAQTALNISFALPRS